MKHLAARSDRTITSKVRIWWGGHDKILLRIAVGLMAFASLVWLGYEFWRFLWQPGQIGSRPVHPGAIDLKIFHEMVHRWFAGKISYRAGYPPASHMILWPLLGWLKLTPAILLWAATTVAALGWLVHLVIQESGTKTRLETVFVALMPLSMYATGATIGNGQLVLHLLPVLIAGLLVLGRGEARWSTDLLASSLVLVSLVKPSITVPFFWIVLLVPGRLRPAVLVSLGYVGLTLVAASFQECGPLAIFLEWLASGPTWAGTVGHAHLGVWLHAFGLDDQLLAAMLLVLLALGWWVYSHRHVDLWLLLGVSGLVARFWTYHRWYDDLLILLPMVALFRLAKQGVFADGVNVLAGALLGITMLVSIAPGGLYLFPAPWNTAYTHGQVIVWFVVLVFLLSRAWQEKSLQRSR